MISFCPSLVFHSPGDLAVGTTYDVWLKDGSDKLVYAVTALNAPHSITLIGENGARVEIDEPSLSLYSVSDFV
jgi:hypothetical protein